MDTEKHKTNRDWATVTSLCFGVASIFLWEFSLIPILAIIFGVIGLLGGGKNKWKAWVGIVLGIVFFFVRFSHGNIDSGFVGVPSSNRVQQTITVAPQDARIITAPANTASPSITNPDYLQNPSAYLMDSKGVLDDTGFYHEGVTSFWVEDIYSPVELITTFVIEKAGQKILEFSNESLNKLDHYDNVVLHSNTLFRKAVTGSNQMQCWKTGTTEYLRTSVLHKRIKLTRSEPSPRIDAVLVEESSGVPTIDLLETMIGSGYGVPGYDEKDLMISKDDPEYIYEKHLLDLAGVAYLAKRGLWGVCQ